MNRIRNSRLNLFFLNCISQILTCIFVKRYTIYGSILTNFFIFLYLCERHAQKQEDVPFRDKNPLPVYMAYGCTVLCTLYVPCKNDFCS
jgi:hypothetical protein